VPSAATRPSGRRDEVEQIVCVQGHGIIEKWKTPQLMVVALAGRNEDLVGQEDANLLELWKLGSQTCEQLYAERAFCFFDSGN